MADCSLMPDCCDVRSIPSEQRIVEGHHPVIQDRASEFQVSQLPGDFVIGHIFPWPASFPIIVSIVLDDVTVLQSPLTTFLFFFHIWPPVAPDTTHFFLLFSSFEQGGTVSSSLTPSRGPPRLFLFRDANNSFIGHMERSWSGEKGVSQRRFNPLRFNHRRVVTAIFFLSASLSGNLSGPLRFSRHLVCFVVSQRSLF